jgi:hypothetical protein
MCQKSIVSMNGISRSMFANQKDSAYNDTIKERCVRVF